MLVVSDDALNAGPAGLVMVVSLTSKLAKSKNIPAHLLVTPPDGGLKTPSVLLCDQLRTISKDRLSVRWGAISPALLADVENVLRALLNL